MIRGQTQSPLEDAIAYALLTLPFSCFLAATLPWMYRTRAKAWRFFMLPLCNGAVVALALPFAKLFE